MSNRDAQPLVVGFVRQHSRHSLGEQKRVMEMHGVARVYDDVNLLIRQRRRGVGDVVLVKRLMLLADPRKLRTSGGMRQSLRETVQAIEQAGGTILEADTGRRRDDPRVAEAMMLDAYDDLARTRARRNKMGRPPREWTAEQKALMAKHWHDLRHATNDDAVAAIRADGLVVSRSQVAKAIGPSGRGRR